MKANVLVAGSLSLVITFFSCNNQKEKADSGEAASPQVKALFVNGDSLHYIDIGKGEPVVFVHGTLGDYRTWGQQLDTFSKHYRVISYSRRYAFPNRQEFNDSADYSVNIHADDLAEFLKTLNTGPVHLVGHSYGAYTALMTTLNHPELVKSLVLGEPPVLPLLQQAPGGDNIINDFMGKAFIPAGEAFRSGNDERAVSIFVGGVMGDSSFFSNIPEQGREIMMANTPELRGAILGRGEFPQVSCDQLKTLSLPVLLLQGENSPALFTAISTELGKCIRNNEKHILANASHGLEFENPAAFNKAVLSFIGKY